jgi:hypothetical protein
LYPLAESGLIWRNSKRILKTNAYVSYGSYIHGIQYSGKYKKDFAL